MELIKSYLYKYQAKIIEHEIYPYMQYVIAFQVDGDKEMKYYSCSEEKKNKLIEEYRKQGQISLYNYKKNKIDILSPIRLTVLKTEEYYKQIKNNEVFEF